MLDDSAPTLAHPLPALAQRLGWLGLLPFAFGALLVWLVRADVLGYVLEGLALYAGLVVSFLGAIHWGAAWRDAEPDPRRLVWGVVPSLLAWVGVMMPPHAGLAWLGAVLWACYLVDRKSYPSLGLSRWLTLRFRLSLIAGFCCFLAAAGVPTAR